MYTAPMPALPVIANVIRCAVQGTLANGREWVNTYHFLKPSGTSNAAAISAIDTLLTNLYNVNAGGAAAAILSQVSNTARITGIAYLPLDGTSATVVISHSLPGLASGDPLPAHVALVVTSQTGLRGRSHRGRVFLPPMAEGQNDASGAPSSGVLVGLQPQFNAFLAAATTAVMFPVVASYRFASQQLITDYVVRSKWSTRRKRQGRQV